jgi:hypothetical protein
MDATMFFNYILFVVVASSRNLLSDLSLADEVTDGLKAAIHNLEAGKRTPLGDEADGDAVREENPRPAELAILQRRSRKGPTIFFASIFVVAFVAGLLVPFLEGTLFGPLCALIHTVLKAALPFLAILTL